MTEVVPYQPTIAIVGRPNVGKSALFNRLVGGRIAIVEDLPGTTRDRISADLDWHGRSVRLIDTGGLETAPSGNYAILVRAQIEVALREADAIIVVVDARDGLTSEDYEVAELLRRAPQPVLLAANKVDNERRELDMVQFYELGLGDPIPVSAIHGYGVSDLLDESLARLPQSAHLGPLSPEASLFGPEGEGLTGPAVAIVGRPNVGKSMLLNALLGEERVIVSEIPGTTRDAVDTELEFRGQRLTLIDTAGMRRRGHIERGLERHSVMRAQQAVERCDVAVVVMDATDLVTAQDTHIIQIALEAFKGLVVAVNKIDVMDEPGYQQECRRLVRQNLRFVPWAPIVLISAKEHINLDPLLSEVLHVAEQRELRVPTGPLNAFLQRVMAEHPPRSVQGKRLKLLYATQASVQPPELILFVNDARLLHFSYQRYLENRLREQYGFAGTVIRLVFKSRPGDRDDPGARIASRPAEELAAAGPNGTLQEARTSRRQGKG